MLILKYLTIPFNPDYCRFEGKVFDEKALYKKEDPNWEAYQKWQGWMRAKARNAGRKFNTRRN